jgi:Xaa-Pro aminopeptidase
MAGGDLLVLDFGCVVDGYASDMTRTALVGGGEAAGWQRELIDIATTAQAAGVAAVRPGLTGAEIDAVCRASIHDAGLGDLFTHGTGHGVGLQIHEAPWVLATSGDVLQPGNVITIEPGVYRIGLGGVRVEDTVLVTADGCRPLTKTPKDLACLRSPRTT